jgi:hypothetical protein
MVGTQESFRFAQTLMDRAKPLSFETGMVGVCGLPFRRLGEYLRQTRFPLRCAVLFLAVMGTALLSPAAPGQATPGSLAGKLTDLQSAPLAGVTLVLRNNVTGAQMRTTTAKNGIYRFTGLDAGEYSLEAESAQLGRGRLDDIEILAGREARIQAAMAFEPFPSAMVLAAAPVAPVKIGSKPEGRPQLALEAVAPDMQLPTEPLWREPLTAKPTPARVAIPPKPNLQIALDPVMSDLRLPGEPLRQEILVPRSAPEPAQRATPGARSTSLPTTLVAMEAAAAIAPETLALFPSRYGATLGSLAAEIPVDAFAANLVVRAMVTRGFMAAMAILPSPYSHLEAASEEADPASPAVTTTLSSAQLQSLPVSGRHWQDFVLDTPGGTEGASSGTIALRGTGQDAPDATIDGASTRLAFGGAANAGPRSDDSGVTGPNNTGHNESSQGFGERGLAISEVAIRSVEIVAGDVEAKGAHAAGGRTNVETRGGSNNFHGQGFLFDRQNSWGARNPFTQWVQNTGTAMAPSFTAVPYTPPDHELTWGVGAGSRLKRDKLFWFGALDAYRRNDPGLATVKTASEFFNLPEPTSPVIALLSAQLGESLNQAYNDYVGIPGAGYAAGLEQLSALLGPAPRTASQWVGFGRLDWSATERQRFTLEGAGAYWNSAGGGLTRVSEDYGNHSFGSSRASEEWLLARWEAFLTPNLLAVTQASAGRDILTARPDTPSAFEQSFLNGNAYGQLPQIVADSRYGFTIGNPSRFGQGSYPDERLYHAQEMLDWVRDKLLVKAGFEIDHNSDATSLLRNQTGTYHYAKVQDFISDALAFEKFGQASLLNYQEPHDCGVTATTFGALPCYSYYSQVMGPTDWQLSTNDWAGYVTGQWQAGKIAVFSAGLRWEREQLPPPLALVNNPELPLTEKLPVLGNQWGPRISLAVGKADSRWPVMRLGYGMYFGRTENATLETALTQTGSLKGDLNFFIRPTDGLNPRTGTSAAPPFPYVLQGQPASVVTPGAVEFALRFRNPEVHQAVASAEESLPGRVLVTAAAMVSLGRRLPSAVDTNFDPAVNPQTITFGVVDKTGQGPIKAPQITVPFYALWPAADCPAGSPLTPGGACGRLNPDFQQITEIMSRVNSTYEAATIKLTRYGQRGLGLHAHYTYAHAMDWNPNESVTVSGSDVLDPEDFSAEYGTSNLDERHSAAAMVIYEAPWKLHHWEGRLANGWMLSGIGQFHSGLPYTMRTAGSLAEEHTTTGAVIAGLGPGMNGSGGDNRVYGVGRNTFRYPQSWKADVRLGKKFDLGEARQLEMLAESYNLFNHQNVTEIETTGYYLESGGATGTLPTLNFLTQGTTGTAATTPAFGYPLDINGTNTYRERQIQFGLRMRF